MAEYSEEQLLARVVAHEPGIVSLREVPAGSIESWQTLTNRAKALGAPQRSWGLVIDLTDVEDRPNASYREFLKESMKTLGADHVAFVQPSSIVLRATVRFVSITFPSTTSVHKEMDEAIVAIRKTLGR